jgi:PAS domain S-box-containing protein
MTATDITAVERIYRQALAALSEGIVVQDKDGAITSCNPAAERILGLSVDQMKGVRSTDPRWRAVHEDGSPFPGEEHPAMVTLRTGLPVGGVIMGVHKPDGSLSWISITSMPFRAGSDGAGEDAVVTTFTDITARWSAEARLRESEQRFQAAIRTMRDAVAILSPVHDETGEIVDFRYDYANDAHCELVGRDREQLLTRHVDEVHPGWARSERFELYRQVALTGEPCRSEDFHPERAWGTEFARRVIDNFVARAGEQLVVSARDVSDRRRIEAKLRASEERFEAAVGSMLDAFAIISPVRDEQGEVVDFRWEYVNDAYCELVGFDRGQLIGHRLVELLPGFPASERFAVYRRVSETGESSLTLDVVSPEAWAGARVADRVLDTSVVAAGENVVVTARDVTERHRLEEQLRASEELFRTGVGSLLDGFTICSPVRDETGEIIDFRWEYANDAACARNGLTREQMLGHRISEALPGYTDTDVFKLTAGSCRPASRPGSMRSHGRASGSPAGRSTARMTGA